MADRNFRVMIEAQWDQGNFVCVGLDPDLAKIPESAKKPTNFGTIVTFNQVIVEATKDLVCAYMPNIAFYEAYGHEGMQALLYTVLDISGLAPGVPVILDAKRGDIGNTNLGYVRMAFESLYVDAITVSPYLGGKALEPFLGQRNKGIFVLCRTSNEGAGEFQDLSVIPDGEAGKCLVYPKLYQVVASRVARTWNHNGNCGLVVGATHPDELRQVRDIVGDMPILIPEIGAQGGEIEATVKAGMDNRTKGMIINSSRGILYSSSGPDFAQAARRETMRLREVINQFRKFG